MDPTGKSEPAAAPSAAPAQALAEAHWEYVEALLDAHGGMDVSVEVVKFHYISAFVHGYKHAQEDK